jgi:hypothetical protein
LEAPHAAQTQRLNAEANRIPVEQNKAADERGL